MCKKTLFNYLSGRVFWEYVGDNLLRMREFYRTRYRIPFPICLSYNHFMDFFFNEELNRDSLEQTMRVMFSEHYDLTRLGKENSPYVQDDEQQMLELESSQKGETVCE